MSLPSRMMIELQIIPNFSYVVKMVIINEWMVDFEAMSAIVNFVNRILLEHKYYIVYMLIESKSSLAQSPLDFAP